MAWELISKAEVAAITGARETDLRDMWYDMALGLIERQTGVTNLGTTSLVTETYSGDGTGILIVRHPPIINVTSITVNGTLLPSTYYIAFGSYIQLVDSFYADSILGHVFDKGSGNIVVVYTSGTDGDYATKLTIALLVKELVNFAIGEGAETKIQFYKPGKSNATEEPLKQWGIHGKMVGIIHTLLGYKMRMK